MAFDCICTCVINNLMRLMNVLHNQNSEQVCDADGCYTTLHEALGMPSPQNNNGSSTFENTFYLIAALLFSYMILTILGRRSQVKLQEKPSFGKTNSNNSNDGGETAN